MNTFSFDIISILHISFQYGLVNTVQLELILL